MELKQPKKLSNKKLTESIGYLQMNDKVILDYITAYITYKGDEKGFTEHLQKLKKKK
jgi:hypothetical protein